MTSRRALEFIGVTRPGLVDLAREMVEESGVETLSPKSLGRQLGLPPSFLTKFFHDFDELQDDLTARALEDLIETHQDFAGDQVGRPSLESFALAERQFGLAHPRLYPIALRGPRGERADLARLRREYAACAEAVTAGYGVPPAMRAELASCVIVALQGFVSAEIQAGTPRQAQDGAYERLLSILDAGARRASEAAQLEPV